MFKKGLTWIIIASVFMGLVALPDSVKNKLPDDPVSRFLKRQKITLGLDLQGGTQLDYRIDLRNVEAKNSDDDKTNDVPVSDIIEGVRNTIERRVNNLGVSEPNIYTSSVGDEQHIVVELAGIKDVDEAKAVVGKTIQLEFKEPKTEADPDEIRKVQQEAEATLQKALQADTDFEVLGENVKTSDGKIAFRKQTQFASDLPERYRTLLPGMAEGGVHPALLQGTELTLDFRQNIRQKQGLYIVQMQSSAMEDKTRREYEPFKDVARELSKESVIEYTDLKSEDFAPEEIDTLQATEEGGVTDIVTVGENLRVHKVVKKGSSGENQRVKASHILIAYQGAERAAETVTRSKADAQSEAERVRSLALEEPETFADLARQYSDEPGAAERGGDLGFFERGQMTKNFEDAVFAMNPGEISDVVETEFGFHVIQLAEKESAALMDVERLVMDNTEENRTRLEERLKRVTEGFEVTEPERQFTYSEIVFDQSPDLWKSTGLDGSHFRYASVAYSQVGQPEVSIEFDSEGARLFEELTGRLVNQPIAIFVGGQLISSPNVQEKISGGNAVITGNFSLPEALELATDLNTGAIDAPIILSSQYTISATLGDSALRVSLLAGLIGLIVLVAFMVLYYRLLGIFAVIALVIYALIMIFILKTSPIVMTLAGIAGIILSIGMAVDANILIFERTREELGEGKNFSAAVAAGFDRAWSSIRDSNVSSLITCTILWFFGNSIIRGFALMLAIGILVSMFTAITVTREFLKGIRFTKLAENRWLLAAKKMDKMHE